METKNYYRNGMEITIITGDKRIWKNRVMRDSIEQFELQGYVLSKTQEEVMNELKEKGFSSLSILGSLEEKQNGNVGL